MGSRELNWTRWKFGDIFQSLSRRPPAAWEDFLSENKVQNTVTTFLPCQYNVRVCIGFQKAKEDEQAAGEIFLHPSKDIKLKSISARLNSRSHSHQVVQFKEEKKPDSFGKGHKSWKSPNSLSRCFSSRSLQHAVAVPSSSWRRRRRLCWLFRKSFLIETDSFCVAIV